MTQVAVSQFSVDNLEPVFDAINVTFVHTQQPIWDEYAKLKGTLNSISKLEAVERVEKELSPVHAFVNLFISYVDQVRNNGHTGYFGNGYHSSSQNGCLEDVKKDDDLFQKLNSLAGAIKSTVGAEDELSKLQEIIDYIKIEIDEEYTTEGDCEECDGSGDIEVDNPDFDADNEDCWEDPTTTETCDNCRGTGIDDEATNYNRGELTEDCAARCDNADNDLCDTKLDERIFVAIANYAVTNGLYEQGKGE